MLSREDVVEVVALQRRGWSVSAIARHTGRDRKTVRAWLAGERARRIQRTPMQVGNSHEQHWGIPMSLDTPTRFLTSLAPSEFSSVSLRPLERLLARERLRGGRLARQPVAPAESARRTRLLRHRERSPPRRGHPALSATAAATVGVLNKPQCHSR
jgi:hypothetical protein